MKKSRGIRHLSKKEAINLVIKIVIFIVLVSVIRIFFNNSIGELINYVVIGAFLPYIIIRMKVSKIYEILIVSVVFFWTFVAYFLDPIFKPYLDKLFSVNTVNSSTTWINILIGVFFLFSYVISRIIFQKRIA
jgi:cation transport ATPase